MKEGRLVSYDDLVVLGEGTEIYCINSKTNTVETFKITYVEEMDLEWQLKLVTDMEPFKDLTISLIEGIFYTTKEAAILSVSNNIEDIMGREFVDLGILIHQLTSKVEKLGTLWYTWHRLQEEKDKDEQSSKTDNGDEG